MWSGFKKCIFFLWVEVGSFFLFLWVEFWKYSFLPQRGTQKFSHFFRDSIFIANKTRTYYFNIVSLMQTSFTTMQYTVLERDGFTYFYLLSHSNVSGPFLFTLCYYKPLGTVVYCISMLPSHLLSALCPKVTVLFNINFAPPYH